MSPRKNESAAPRSQSARPRRCAWPAAICPPLTTTANGACPLKNDRKLFEFLVLDAVQAGLSWEIILRKREGFRAAFDGFDPVKDRALRPARKFKPCWPIRASSAIASKSNPPSPTPARFSPVQKEFGSFARYIWQFVGGAPASTAGRSLEAVPARTAESDAMSRALKKRGFRFVGSTICYAFMQAAGMVNDHSVDCFRHAELARRMQRWRIRCSEIQ